MTLERNKPDELGRAAGEILASFADDGEAAMFADGEFTLPRCKSCAFRPGTYPNGCVTTVADALKCAMEAEPFYCHEVKKGKSPDRLCNGWIAARVAVQEKKPIATPWKFSHEYTDEDTGARQEGRCCAVFRNEGAGLSSDLIRAADAYAWQEWPGERHYTTADPEEIRSTNPGFCFLQAGWRKCGTSKGGLQILEILPEVPC